VSINQKQSLGGATCPGLQLHRLLSMLIQADSI